MSGTKIIIFLFQRGFRRGDVKFKKRRSIKKGNFKKFSYVLTLFVVALSLFIPVIGVSYYSIKISDLNRKIALLKQEENFLIQEYTLNSIEYSKLTSPENLSKKMRELGLRFATPEEIVVLESSGSLSERIAYNLKKH